jgi:uncharacterized protein YdhG (YjbR/CyaY superfamily)
MNGHPFNGGLRFHRSRAAVAGEIWHQAANLDRQTEGSSVMAKQAAPRGIDAYIAAFSPEVQSILEKIRATIRQAVPEAKETISYKMPAFTLDGMLIYFAAFKKHIGIYPPVQGDEKLRKETGPFRGEKGNLKFPLDEPIPYALIRRVVQFRVKEHRKRVTSRRGQKKR